MLLLFILKARKVVRVKSLVQLKHKRTFSRSFNQEKDTEDSGGIEESWKVFQNGCFRNVFSWNMTIRAYAKSGHLQEAKDLFDKIPSTNLFSWNLITSACNKLGEPDSAKELFHRMPERNFMTWNSMIAGYAQFGHLSQAQNFLEMMPEHNVVTWTCVMDGYAKASHLSEAESLFTQMPERNIVSWNAMLQGYAQSGRYQEAELLYARIPHRNMITSTSMITSYAGTGTGTSAVSSAKSVFDRVPSPDPVCMNALLTVYAQNGDVDSSKAVFDDCPYRDVISWNNLLQAFAENGQVKGAKSTFNRMPQRGLVSWTSLLVACAQGELLNDAKLVFDSMPVRNVVSWTAMVAAYGNTGLVDEAEKVFDLSPQRDEVSWSAMISGFALNGRGYLALLLFKLMDLEGLRVDAVTYVSVLDACSGLAALSEAKALHRLAAESGYESEMIVGNALVNVYGKCGRTSLAKQAFDGTSRRNVYSWTGLISAYAHNGLGGEALQTFEEMKLEGVEPGGVTLTCLLNICSHAGLPDAALERFSVLVGDYGLAPTLDHYVCLVDGLGRAGRVEQGEELLNNMPYEPGGVAWMSLLGACETSYEFEVGVRAARRVVELEPESTSAYVLVCGLLRMLTLRAFSS